jgi:hypothetical protein
MAVEICWSCGGVSQPCECITEYGEAPIVIPVDETNYANNYVAQNGTYLPICGTNGDEDPETYQG